ncbi:hypothetical protein HanPSC8_Chr02g0055601 [Helianthus annuus]|nr:hypothetical protein HanPSC8_Chr02g0055601 [Helianthus annuus]
MRLGSLGLLISSLSAGRTVFEPTFEMFNTIYSVSYSQWVSTLSRLGWELLQVCSVPIKGIHDWKQKFFYIRRGVIPTDMSYRQVGQGVPRVDVPPNYGDQDWFKKITAKPTAISQLDENGFGWCRDEFVVGSQTSAGSACLVIVLLNTLDPKSAGAMVEAIQADGNPTWLEQIHDRFLHPTDVSTVPGGVAEAVHGFAKDDDDAEASVDPSAQLETRKKARTEKSVRREEKKEGGAAGSSRKQPSTLPYLDYVVVSDTLSGLGPGEVRQGGGRGNLLEEIFDASASRPGTLVSVNQDWQETTAGGYFSDYSTYFSSVEDCWLDSPQDDADASVKGGEGFFEGMFEGGNAAGGDVGGDAGGGRGGGGDIAGADRGKGIEVEVESSETTPQQTVYTKRPPGGGGATSGAVRDSYFERVPDDSWGNPACDDMPHVPRWSLTQGSPHK